MTQDFRFQETKPTGDSVERKRLRIFPAHQVWEKGDGQLWNFYLESAVLVHSYALPNALRYEFHYGLNFVWRGASFHVDMGALASSAHI